MLLSFRNLGEGEPGMDPFQLVEEPAASTQRCPEALQMDVIEECTGTHTKCLPFTATALSTVISTDL